MVVVKILSNKKRFVGRIVIIQSALNSPDLTECITYSKCTRTTHEKAFKDFKSQNLCKKPTHNGRSRKASESWISENPLESHFPVENFHPSYAYVLGNYVKQSPTSGNCSALWIMTIRPTVHFLLKEKGLSSGFSEIQVSEALQDLPLCMGFWQRLWIMKSLKDFSCVVRVRSEYVIHSVRSGEFSALWIMTIRPTKHFLFDKVLTTPTFLAVWTLLL